MQIDISLQTIKNFVESKTSSSKIININVDFKEYELDMLIPFVSTKFYHHKNYVFYICYKYGLFLLWNGENGIVSIGEIYDFENVIYLEDTITIIGNKQIIMFDFKKSTFIDKTF